VPCPLSRPQTYSFNARINILTAFYISYQYLSIDPKKIFHDIFNAYKLKKVALMNADISDTIEDRELGFQI